MIKFTALVRYSFLTITLAMNYLKKAKSAMKDVQDLQKGMKDMGFSFGDKKEQQVRTTKSSWDERTLKC